MWTTSTNELVLFRNYCLSCLVQLNLQENGMHLSGREWIIKQVLR